MPLPPHINTASDLVTSRAATTEGFISQAREKVRLASRHISDARRLERDLGPVVSPQDALRLKGIGAALLSAVGISQKALAYLDINDQEKILTEVLSEIQRQAGMDWKSELVLRFALTRGDSLGGTSRNLAGATAKNLFADAVVHALSLRGIAPTVSRSQKDKKKIRSLSWAERLIVFDRLPHIVGKNIDVIVVENRHNAPVQELLETKAAYVACGEVKGGIDPAGADEHWKTANTALERVRSGFGLQRPALFFTAAAIVDSMAGEIISQLRDNRMTFAANLTKTDQVADLANWLVSL